MKIYIVDYNVADEAAFKATPTKFPTYILASNFDSAVNIAKNFETPLLSVRELKLASGDGLIAIEAPAKEQVNVGQ